MIKKSATDSNYLLAHNLESNWFSTGAPQPRMVFVSTIQFVASLQTASRELKEKHGFLSITVPQAKPLSPGEILGCTSRVVKDADILVYLGNLETNFCRKIDTRDLSPKAYSILAIALLEYVIYYRRWAVSFRISDDSKSIFKSI